MNDDWDIYRAHRAAGQVIAALAEAVSIDRVSVKGIVLKSGEGPPREQYRHEVLQEIAIGLTGIAAVGRYRFGTPPAGEPANGHSITPQSFTAWQLADFEEVKKLVALIDPAGEQNVLYQAWQQARSSIHNDAIWEAIEFYATLLPGSPLDGTLIDYVCPEIFAGIEGFDAEAGRVADRRPSGTFT